MTKTRQAVVNCALNAAVEATSRYMAMSGGKTIHDHAIETFISSKVAEAIYDQTCGEGGTVALEPSFGEVWEASGARKGRASASLSKRARFDICYYEKGKPLGIIEVKKRFAAYKASHDILRIETAMETLGADRGGSVRFGIWLAVQRVAENSRTTVDSQKTEFIEAFDWANEPEVLCRTVSGSFGAYRRSLRAIVELRIYAVSFTAEN